MTYKIYHEVINNRVHRHRVYNGDQPLPHWLPGLGLTPEQLAQKNQRIAQSLSGRTLPQETKQQMRQAKLNVPKSDYHRQQIKQACIKREQEIRQVMQEYPSIKYREAIKLLNTLKGLK